MKLNTLSFYSVNSGVGVMEISAHSFLHNMVRKIFYYCDRYSRTGRVDTECIKVADGEALLFAGCEYDNKLNFIGEEKESFRKIIKRREIEI